MVCHWQSPPPGFLKMNTDASCMGSPGKASYGGIFRNELGNWVKGFYGKLSGLYTPLEAEVWAICKGFNLIKHLGFNKVMVETDSVGALELFSFRHLRENHPMKDVIEEGLEILRQRECVIVHTRRDGNECADKLAKLGGRQLEDCKVIHMPPLEVVPLLLKDKFGENWRKVTSASQTSESYGCAPVMSPLLYHHRPVCVPLYPPIGLLHHQQSLRRDLQQPRMIFLH